MDGSFFDKYGAPITLKDHWMDGYDKHGVFYVDLLIGNDLNVAGIMLWTGCWLYSTLGPTMNVFHSPVWQDTLAVHIFTM